VYRALAVFGAPLSAFDMDEADFATCDGALQMSVPPMRIDILNGANLASAGSLGAWGPCCGSLGKGPLCRSRAEHHLGRAQTESAPPRGRSSGNARLVLGLARHCLRAPVDGASLRALGAQPRFARPPADQRRAVSIGIDARGRCRRLGFRIRQADA